MYITPNVSNQFPMILMRRSEENLLKNQDLANLFFLTTFMLDWEVLP